MKISNSVSNFIVKNKPVQKMFTYANNNPSLFESMFVFTLASTIRPITIATVPSDKDNKKFYISRSIITGCLDLMTTGLYFIPMKKWSNNMADKLINLKNTSYFQNPEVVNAFKKVLDRGSKFVMLPIQAALLFYLIPKTVDKWFNKGKQK